MDWILCNTSKRRSQLTLRIIRSAGKLRVAFDISRRSVYRESRVALCRRGICSGESAISSFNLKIRGSSPGMRPRTAGYGPYHHYNDQQRDNLRISFNSGITGGRRIRTTIGATRPVGTEKSERNIDMIGVVELLESTDVRSWSMSRDVDSAWRCGAG